MKRLITALLAASMLAAGLCACGGGSSASTEAATESAEIKSSETSAYESAEPEEKEIEAPSEKVDPVESENGAPAESYNGASEVELTDTGIAAENAPVYEGTDISIAVLSGPTGIGAVSLMEANDAGETVNNYSFSIVAANDEIVAGIASGEYDIAAAATNIAATLYNKTSGGVQICALNTLGVLYILENGDTIHSMADLAGHTIYANGQGANPEYVLEYLLTANGLTYSTDGSEADVMIEFMAADAISAGMAAGEYDVCMLPVPAVTSVMVQNQDVRSAIDLTEEWNTTIGSGVMTMGSIIVRSDFAKDNPEAVDAFLEEYSESITAVQEDVQHAAELCEAYGIVAKAAIAAKAIPDCNLCFIAGEDIQPAIEPYYQVLFDANPSSIGGSMPGDDFYYTGADAR